MTGFLPILTASNGATPQTAPEAVTAPATGAEGAFAAVLAGLSGADGSAGTGTAPSDARVPGEAQTALTGETRRAYVVSSTQSAGSALQRLKLAFAGTGTLPAGLGLKAGTASSILSLVPASASAVPGAATEGTLPDGAAVTLDAKPVHQQAASKTQAQAQASPAAAEATIATLPQAGNPASALPATLPLTGKTDADTNSAPEAGDTKPADQTATPADPAALAAAMAQQAMAQPVAPMPATLAMGGAASAAASDGDATLPAAPAQASGHASGKAGAQPEQRPADMAARPAEPAAAEIAALSPAPAPVSPAITDAAAPATDDAAALAAIAPAAGRVAAAPAPMAEPARDGETLAAAPVGAEVSAAPANSVEGGDADAPAQGRIADTRPASAQATGPGAFDALMAQSPRQPGTVSAAEPRAAAGKPAAIETGLADKPVAEMVAGAEKRPTADRTRTGETRAEDGDAAKPKADTAQGAQTAQAARPAVVMTEAPAVGQPAAPQSAAPDGVQPLSAHPAAAPQGTSPHTGAQPHAADVVKVATPHHLPEAVGMAISRHVGNDATEFALRLDPADLGRIEVKLELGKDGQAVVHIQADNASTMDLLRRDAHALERALADTGLRLDSGGLNFSLRQQDGQGQQQFASGSGGRSSNGREQETALSGVEPDATQRPGRRSATGLLDLSI